MYKIEDIINKIHCADCLEFMKDMPGNSVDAIVTDPPYGLEFMGKEWDKLWNKSQSFNINRPKSGAWYFGNTPSSQKRVQYKAGLEMQLWHTRWLTEAYRVLKPGGSMLVMGGTRTFHRLACAIEDTGFIIKDTILWLFGSGFPKSQDITPMIDGKKLGKTTKQLKKEGWEKAITEEAKHWDGFKVGGIKPAYEPIIWAVKPPEGSYVDNVLKWGVGAVNVDECRVGINDKDFELNTRKASKQFIGVKPFGGDNDKKGSALLPNTKGRFPANVILDEEAGRMLDEQSGNIQSGGGKKGVRGGIFGNQQDNPDRLNSLYQDSGGASRFFYCAKASKSERGENNKHPTVKPIALFMWLIQLVTRERQLILDPFMGSGTTMLASQGCNRRCVGIEKDKDYCKVAEERLAQGVL